MKIEFTRAELVKIILDHIKDEIAPYTKFELEYWDLPNSLTAVTKEQEKEKDAAQ